MLEGQMESLATLSRTSSSNWKLVMGNEELLVSENPIVDKSFDFAVKIVNLARNIRDKREYELARQLLRCGTSIGANVAEAQNAQSDRDFLAKMYIALKEASETKYWIELLHATEIISDAEHRHIIKDMHEILKILSAITKSLERKLGIKE